MTNAEHARRILLILLTERRHDAGGDRGGLASHPRRDARDQGPPHRPDPEVGRPPGGEGRALSA